MSNTDTWSITDSNRIYNLARWGQGYFSINEKGHLCVLCKGHTAGPCIDIVDVIQEIEEQNIQLPIVIRFHDILREQVIKLNKTFQRAIEEAQFAGRYMGVFPIKVNQLREVVEELLDAGHAFQYGIEAGSKSELLIALALNENQQALTIVNGQKDDDILKLALLGRQLGRKVVVVIERFNELERLIKLSQEMQIEPIIGIRAKLTSEGSGKWACSSGERAKFGLSIAEILQAVEFLKRHGMQEHFKLLHFHIGSQVTDIRSIKNAVIEAARIYAKLRKAHLPIEYFDVGGGLGVDYNGTRSMSDSSINYTVREYVEDIVYTLKEICNLEEVDHPHIVTETGRAIAAPHSCVITNVLGSIKKVVPEDLQLLKNASEHILVKNMRDIQDELAPGRLQEIYNDATQKKEESFSAFKLGILSLDDLAKVETLYWQILHRILALSLEHSDNFDDLENIKFKLADQYLCNFSIFQSALDTWAIKQVLPIMPVTRLNERPTVDSTLADITCDSDGKIDHFINYTETQSTLPLHVLRAGERYYIGLFLTGAYQDIMGDNHNLFGRLNEVHVYGDDEDPNDFYIEEFIRGNTAKDVLRLLQYNPEAMAHTVKKQIDKQIQRKKIRPKEGVKLIDFYEDCMYEYTYLKQE